MDTMQVVVAHHLVRTDAEDALDRRPDVAQTEILAGDEDDVGAVLDQRPQAIFAVDQPRRGRVALADVDRDAEHGRAAFELDHAAAELDPERIAVLRLYLELI